MAEELLNLGGSDLHISSGSPPMARVEGNLLRIAGEKPVKTEDLWTMLVAHLEPRQVETLKANRSLDLILALELAGGPRRFRANFFVHRQGLSAVLRLVPETPPNLSELGLPRQVERLVRHRQGLVLLTGPSGCGKSTTAASLVHHLNQTCSYHIVTLEDPIEYVHRPDRSLINQRQVGLHTRSFAAGLRAALREMPDVILVGELRDIESAALAVTAAETGHLVLSTMHTSNAVSTIDRLINSFPAGQKALVRTMLADSLRGIVCQHLLPRADGKGRVAAVEVLVNTPAVANLIRESRTYQIPAVMETGRQQGMRLMEHSLQELLERGVISPRTAGRRGFQKSLFETPLERF
jgi:twitching motility protein PilT